jgi:hypothetical protein
MTESAIAQKLIGAWRAFNSTLEVTWERIK